MSYENESTADLIRERVEILCGIFNRKSSNELTAAFTQHLAKFDGGLLRRVFSRAERDMEKFPTVRKMLELCREESPSSADDYRYRNAVAKDPETGTLVNVFMDSKGETMFRAADCTEGRAFLVKLREIAKKLAVPELSPAEKPWEATNFGAEGTA